jgi:hypothetical protein
VPAFKEKWMIVGGKEILVGGRWLRMAHPDGDGYHFLENPQVVLDGLRKARGRVDLFTFMQKVSDVSPKHPYPMEWDNFAALSISTFDQWWNEQIGFKARNKAKQAEKRGVVVREVPFDETLVKGIWEVYNETTVRQGKPNAHFGKDLETIYQEEATFLESSVFIGAYLDDKLIGFVKMVADETRTQAGLMNIVSMVRHRDKAPSNALVAEAVRACAKRGIPYLVYSSFSYGKKERDTLSDFKERNGFQKICVPRYYVPLTPIGQLAYKLGLHKRFSERLPEPLLAKLRDVRNAWYRRKQRSIRNEAVSVP